MVERYKHTQVGYSYMATLMTGLLVLVVAMFIEGFNWGLIAGIITLSVCIALFTNLTVAINEDSIILNFGGGIVKRNFLWQIFVLVK